MNVEYELTIEQKCI